MSTEWFLQAHVDGGFQEIRTSDVLLEIKKEKIKKYNDSIDVFFEDDQFSTLYFDTRAKTVSSLMIGRPVVSSRLDALIYRLMKLGNFVFFAPDAAYPISLVSNIGTHLPEGMAESLGLPRIASSSDEFAKLLAGIYE
jgi:hypothetical protein